MRYKIIYHREYDDGYAMHRGGQGFIDERPSEIEADTYSVSTDERSYNSRLEFIKDGAPVMTLFYLPQVVVAIPNTNA